MDVTTATALENQENISRQKSVGKRPRDGFHKNVGSNSKRQALASISNHVDIVTERQKQKTKASSSCCMTSLSSSLSHLDTPGGFASPMLVSSPSGLACSETIDTDLVEDDACACCGDYARDIFSYLKEAEVRWQPQVGYMLKQPDITTNMRSVLVDWLVEVVDEFSLQSSTLYLAVSLVDRFLSHMSVLRGKLQLVGSTAMYMAAKLEEIYPPELSDFAYITDNTYTQQQIVHMERLMLQTLDYHLLAPSSLCFLHRFLQAAGTPADPHSSSTVTHLAQYLCELALMNSDPFLKYLPSEVAASSVCLARHTLEQPAWPPNLHRCTGYSVCDIGHCLQDMHRIFAMSAHHPQQAVRLKYCSEKFRRVATFTVPETLPM